MSTDLLTTQQAARLLGVTRYHVTYWRRAGHLTGWKPGQDWFYTREEVDALAQRLPLKPGRKTKDRGSE